jgi:arylsulfatase A-like enzyme
MEGRNLLSPTRIFNNQKQMVFSQYGNLLYSVRTHEWKLIENVLLNNLELYNLENDPNELVNLASKYPERCDFYRDKITTWRSSRIRLKKLKEESIPYTEEGLERLRTLGYVE